MDVAFIVFDEMTALDSVGAHDAITRLGTMGFMELGWDVCATTEESTATAGLTVVADRIRPHLGDYDAIVVPGGVGTRDRRNDETFVDWLRTADVCEYKVSVCTGSLLLGAAGFLDGKVATTHPSAFDLLEEYCAVSTERVVEDGDTITARGVASSVDCGLYVVETLTDEETHDAIARQMDYPHYAKSMATDEIDSPKTDD